MPKAKSKSKVLPPQRRAITPEELAERWGLNYRTILDWIGSGKIPAIDAGRKYRISMDWVEAQERGWHEPVR